MKANVFVIMKGGFVLDEKFFECEDSARNYIKFKYPKRQFKNQWERIFVCKNYGTKLTIVELYKN